MEKKSLKELEGLFEKLCKKGKAYRAKRMRAGEKSSAYLSGRAVKVCKGQMQGENIEELEAEDDTEFTVSLKHLLKKHVNKGGEIEENVYYVDAVNENETYSYVGTEAMLETGKETRNRLDEKKGKGKN